jgi:hypothetical protein
MVRCNLEATSDAPPDDATEISGSTLFLPDPEMLPLNDLPILGTVNAACSDERLDELMVERGQLRQRGGQRVEAIRALGQRRLRAGQLDAFALNGVEPREREGHGVCAGPQVNNLVLSTATRDDGADFFNERWTRSLNGHPLGERRLTNL